MNEYSEPPGSTAVLLLAHGAPNRVDDIPLYLKNIRGGTESSPEVIQLIRERYEAIGGSSPLLDITQNQAKEVERFLNQNGGDFKVYVGMRNWSPYISDVVGQMVKDGVGRVLALCLAPQYSTWSTERYFNALKAARVRHEVWHDRFDLQKNMPWVWSAHQNYVVRSSHQMYD